MDSRKIPPIIFTLVSVLALLVSANENGRPKEIEPIARLISDAHSLGDCLDEVDTVQYLSDLNACMPLWRVATEDLNPENPGLSYSHYFFFAPPDKKSTRALTVKVKTAWDASEGKFKVLRRKDFYDVDYATRTEPTSPNQEALKVLSAALKDTQVLDGLTNRLGHGVQDGVRQIFVSPQDSGDPTQSLQFKLSFFIDGLKEEPGTEVLNWDASLRVNTGEVRFYQD